VVSHEGALASASAVLLIVASNEDYNQPALRIDQAGKGGGAASIKINDPNPDIEFVETDQTAPAGRYEIAVQSDKLQLNGRNESNTAFEPIVVFQRVAAGGNIGVRTASQFGAGKGRHCDRERSGGSVGESGWRWDPVRRGRSAQISRHKWNGDDDRTGLIGRQE
jgi:hypothetical protein